MSTPEWVRDAIFYQIFPDRFAQSVTVPKPSGLEPWDAPPTYQGYKGGDLAGVAEHLDYLQQLGVNAIYFTPIFQSASNHRYHTHDYERVDPMLGGDAALRLLLEQAHSRGMKVVLDGVFNHASRGFFPFHDILENGEHSAYLDWFHINKFPLNAYDHQLAPGYGAWWNLHALPKFNIKTPAVRKYLLGVARKWVDFGIDGWRLDVANEIDDDEFWREFRRTIHEGNPNAYIVGEVWHDASHWLQGDMWDAVMNYLFTRECIAFFIGDRVDTEQLNKTSLRSLTPTNGPAFRQAIDSLLKLYRPEVTAVQLNLLSSHDMPRFLTLARGDLSALRLATLFQMTYPGAPSIYYGDEIGLEGKHDPANRGAFPWQKPEAWNHDLLAEFQRLTALRHRFIALRRGDFTWLDVGEKAIAYMRQHGSEVVVVMINTSDQAKTVDLTLPGQRTRIELLNDPWTAETFRFVDRSPSASMTLEPRSYRVLIGSTEAS